MKQKSAYTVAVVGATGAVGAEMIEILEERKFPVDVLRPLASYRSAGGRVTFHDQEFVVRELAKEDRKSTRLNSSHSQISYAVFCLKKKKGGRDRRARQSSSRRGRDRRGRSR